MVYWKREISPVIGLLKHGPLVISYISIGAIGRFLAVVDGVEPLIFQR